MPRRISCVSLLKHFINCNLVAVPLFPVTPVFFCYLPTLLRSILPVLKSFKLRILIYLNPELYNNCAPVCKLLLEFINLNIRSLPVIRTAEAFKSFNHNSSVPCSVKAICPVLGSLFQNLHR